MAQQGTLRGIVSDQATGRPLYGANVVLQSVSDEDNTMGAAADKNGFYRIGSIMEGTYRLRISFIGFAAYEDTLSFEEEAGKTINIALESQDAALDELVIEQGISAVRKVEGSQRITPVDLGRIPGPATGDLASYLQTLPGATVTGDRGGQIYIRGGTPSQNLALVDGAMIYRPTHIVGFFSPFSEKLVSGIDFYAGGYGPRYNSRISSVLDIQMKSGDRFDTSGSGSISPFMAEVVAEGPMREGKSSFLVSARKSLIESTSSSLPIKKQPLKFESQYAKLSFTDENLNCSVSSMHTYDRGQIDFEVDESTKWSNFIFGGRCVALPEGSKTLVETNINFSKFSNSTSGSEALGFSSKIWRANVDVNLQQYAGEVRFDYGIFSRLKNLNYAIGEQFVGLDNDNASQFVLGGYLQTTIPLTENLDVQPGIALSLYPGDFPVSFEPRFRFTWQPFGREKEEVFGAAGIYRQPVTGISDSRDANSVFTAWTSAPIGQSQLEARHAILGWQQTLADGINYSVEGYYKRTLNQPVPIWNTIARFTTELSPADGNTYGSDLQVEYGRGGFYSMVGYGYSWTQYEAAQELFSVWFGEPVQEYHPPHDRRHQVNALVSFDMGPYTAGVNWQLSTGLSYTRPIGFDDILDFRRRLPDVELDQGIRRVVLDRPYDGRLPTVHRLDISVERTFAITSSGLQLNAELGVVNAYDQKNIFYYDIYTQRRINQLAFFPYLTLQIET
jgi:hypothetical protein